MKKRIPLSIPMIGNEEKQKVIECVESTFVSSVGPMVTEFEQKFAKYHNVSYAVACSSGTAALHLALIALNITKNDYVIAPDFTFIASTNPVLYQCAKPILVDAELNTFNPDPSLIVKFIEEKAQNNKPLPKAVIALHLYGTPMIIEPLVEVCDKFNIPIIEDATESLGAFWSDGKLKNKKVGTVGKLGCFSFNGNKIITTGGGGMIISDDKLLIDKIRHISTQARSVKNEYFHNFLGYNYRLTNIQAALGLAQFEKLPLFLKKKQKFAEIYNHILKDIKGLEIPNLPNNISSSYWLYSILIHPECGLTARNLRDKLARENIETRTLWTPLHKMPMYQTFRLLGGNNGEYLYEHGLNLPSSVTLDESDIEFVAQTIKKMVS